MLLPDHFSDVGMGRDDEEGEGVGLLGDAGSEGPFDDRYSDPFSDNNGCSSSPPHPTKRLPRSPPLALQSLPVVLPSIASSIYSTPSSSALPSSSAVSPLPRSVGMTSFYPDVVSPFSSHQTEPTVDSITPQTGHSPHASSDTTPTATRSSSPSSQARPPSIAPTSAAASSRTSPTSHTSSLPTSVTSTTLSSLAPVKSSAAPVTRSQSTTSQLSSKSTGWRRVLGLGLRIKSPPPAPSSSSNPNNPLNSRNRLPSQRLLMDLHDPSTPPSLDFVEEEERGLRGLGRETRERLGLLGSGSTGVARFHGQDGSVNDSLRSARE